MQSMTRGTKPITKNIRVIDAAGNEYEATYPKRAKGLAKNGRARFIDENTLCLACPPNDYLEDKSMNNMLDKVLEDAFEHGNGPRPAEATTPEPKVEMSLEWVMARTDAIINDNAHIDAIKTLTVLESDGGLGSRAHAICGVVEAHEATNQQTLRFLEKMYDDLKPQSEKVDRTDVDRAAMLSNIDLTALAENLESEHVVDIVKAITGK